MENKKPNNPSAFPEPFVNDPNLSISHTKGMSLRDYFAAKAMQATNLEQYADYFGDEWAERVAIDSYQLADEMLKQREL